MVMAQYKVVFTEERRAAFILESDLSSDELLDALYTDELDMEIDVYISDAEAMDCRFDVEKL